MKQFYFLSIITILSSLFLSPVMVYAGNADNSSFMEIGTKQGWFIPNDYETSMNPPACILREPTQIEYIVLIDYCKGINDSTVNCDDQVKEFLKNWEKNNCQKLGMKVKTLSDGSLRSYFPPKPTNSPTQSPITTAPSMATPTLNKIEEVQQELKKKREFSYPEIAGISALVAITSIAIYNKFLRRKK